MLTGEHATPSGLYKIGHRYYLPNTGRWTQRDPLSHLNPANPPEGMPWNYVGNNPCNYTDPTGRTVAEVAGAVLGVVVGSFTGVLRSAAVAGAVGLSAGTLAPLGLAAGTACTLLGTAVSAYVGTQATEELSE